MADTNPSQQKPKKPRLGTDMITNMFGGLLGAASDALQGQEEDASGKKQKSKRQRILDET